MDHQKNRLIITRDIAYIYQARSLLYQVYIEEDRWQFSPHNPSGLRVLCDKQTQSKFLADDWDERAWWALVLYEERVIACGRLCVRDSSGCFELQYYATEKHHSLLSREKYPFMVELSKLAVAKGFRRSGLPFLLLRAAFQMCCDLGSSTFTASAAPTVHSIYVLLQFPKLEGYDLKYDARDTHSAQLFLADFEAGDIKAVLLNLNAIIESLNIPILEVRGYEQAKAILRQEITDAATRGTGTPALLAPKAYLNSPPALPFSRPTLVSEQGCAKLLTKPKL